MTLSHDMVEAAARAVWNLRCEVARKANIRPPLDTWEDEQEGLREAVRAEVRTAFSALGDTHVIVPRLASDKMICAALDDWDERKRAGSGQTYGSTWAAMIAASQTTG